MSNTVHVLTTYNTLTLETDTSGGFTDLDQAKREAQDVHLIFAEQAETRETYRVFIEEWDGSMFMGQRSFLPEHPDMHGWYFQPAHSSAPYREGGLVS